MYSKIQEMKTQGFSIRQVSRLTGTSRDTIRKYWEMPAEDYADTFRTVNRTASLSAYEAIVVKWLEAYPCMAASQVRDWLEEKYRLDASGRTVRRFVEGLRCRYGISKQTEPRREYEAVEELPRGQQLQLDFGEKSVRDAYSNRYIKLYFVVFTLSYSRFKWGIFQDRPFLSADLVHALYACFDYFGGMPRQLVYDQDSIIVVSENSGDIIHTQAFAAFLVESKLNVRVCRKSDPETKGLVEASVKFVKRNYMENRLYMGLELWNRSFWDWLERTGNGQQHGTTKRKPAEMFAEEHEHLLPLYGAPPAAIKEDMDRVVRADNTILYLANRYSLPLGTYGKEKTVFLTAQDGKLQILDRVGEVLATHQISTAKGKLIKLDAHRRNKSVRIKEILDETVSLPGEEFQSYLTEMCEEKPRYVKEQLAVVTDACKTYGRQRVLEAVSYCQGLELKSANDLMNTLQTMFGQRKPPLTERLPVEDERYHIPVQKRSLSVYTELAAGSGVIQ